MIIEYNPYRDAKTIDEIYQKLSSNLQHRGIIIKTSILFEIPVLHLQFNIAEHLFNRKTDFTIGE